MNYSNYHNNDDQIDFRELLITLWCYKFFIILVALFSVFLGLTYSANMDKKYTSRVIFKLNDESQANSAASNGLAMLGIMQNLGTASFSLLPEEEINGRVFIEKIDAKVDLREDPYFNNYDPNFIEQDWKIKLKNLIGWENIKVNQDEIVWQRIIKRYKKNIFLNETDSGAFIIEVTHSNSNRSAYIANQIMDTILHEKELKREIDNKAELDYLSDILAKALTDLDMSQTNLKTFTLENSALPLESFAQRTIALEALREQVLRTENLYDAVVELNKVLDKKTLTQKDYFTLKQKFPVIDEVEFRRIIGQNEIISTWNWPSKRSIRAVIETLDERTRRLQLQIDASQKDAERSGDAFQTYTKLVREANIAEATYAVMMEQVKAQSMITGFEKDSSKIFEYASPSVTPTSPKKFLILAISTVLGIFLGCAFALILGVKRNVFFSRDLMLRKSNAQFNININSLKSLRKHNYNDKKTMLEKKPRIILGDIAVEIYNGDSKFIAFTSSNAKLTAYDIAQLMSIYMQSEDVKVAIINYSNKKFETNKEDLSISAYKVSQSYDNVSILTPKLQLGSMRHVSERDFVKNLQSLKSSFDFIFLCAENSEAISVLRSVQSQKLLHIMIARIKYTKYDFISRTSYIKPIQVLLHD